jgi:hypothetical protein
LEGMGFALNYLNDFSRGSHFGVLVLKEEGIREYEDAKAEV